MAPRDRAMPGWPRALSQPLAAAYLSLSEGSFRAQVMPDVPPIHLTGRRIAWLKEDLDAWLDRRADRPPPEPEPQSAEREAANQWDRALGVAP